MPRPAFCGIFDTMTLTQTVKIPDDYRIFLELPRSVPSGIMAKINIDIPVSAKTPEQNVKAFWKRFDAGAAASSEEVLQDDDFPRTSSNRKLELF